MSVDPAGVLYGPAGVASFMMYSIAPSAKMIAGAGQMPPRLVLSLGSGPVGISTTRAYETVATLRNRLDVARRREEAFLRDRFGEGRMGEGMAVKAAAMWTTISTPGENGGGM